MQNSFERTDKEIEEIYQEYADTVYRISLMMLKNQAEAQDATQNVFIKLMTAKKTFASQEHIKAWLIVTTQNTCKTLLKGWWWKKQIDSDSVFKQAYMLDDTEWEIWDMLTSLPEKFRLPLYLHYYEGYKTQEIAAILQMNPATVRTRLWTARKKLKLMLEEDELHG